MRYLRLVKGSDCDLFMALNSLRFWGCLRSRAMRNFLFLLLCSPLAEKAMPSQLVMEFCCCISTQCKDITGLHSWTSAVWDRGNLPLVQPSCSKPLLHHQEKIVFLTLLLQTEGPKCLLPSSLHVAPYCFSKLVEIIQEQSTYRWMWSSQRHDSTDFVKAKVPPAFKPSPRKAVLLFYITTSHDISWIQIIKNTFKTSKGF